MEKFFLAFRTFHENVLEDIIVVTFNANILLLLRLILHTASRAPKSLSIAMIFVLVIKELPKTVEAFLDIALVTRVI